MSYENAINQRKEQIEHLKKAKKLAPKGEKKAIQDKIDGLRKYIRELDNISKRSKR